MQADKIDLGSVGEAAEAIKRIGADTHEFMATRAIHINVLIKDAPAEEARLLKRIYNDIGAEVAISHDAYHEEGTVATDIIAMGTVYQHREAKRILSDNTDIQPWISAIEAVVEGAPETRE